MLPLAGKTWEAARGNTFRSRVEDIGFNHLSTGDLNGDGLDEILGVDGNQNLLQILTWDPEQGESGGWKSAMHFQVFKSSPFGRSGGRGQAIQPHKLIVHDFTGDGAKDLLALCHNRILLYPAPSKAN